MSKKGKTRAKEIAKSGRNDPVRSKRSAARAQRSLRGAGRGVITRCTQILLAMPPTSRPAPPLHILTPRLRLLAFTAESAGAAVSDRERFARAIEAVVPGDWPPETLADVEEMLAAKLAENPHEVGWWGWYIIALPGVVSDNATLIGSAGCSKWGKEGHPHFGYGILPAFYRQGFTSEAAVALIEWAMAQPGVNKVQATTFERHIASIKILQKCGFEYRGISPEDHKAAESDRQGRGKLIVFVREKK